MQPDDRALFVGVQLNPVADLVDEPQPVAAAGAGGGAWLPASGFMITPLSRISHTISSRSCQISIEPGERACRTVFAAISLTAITKSTTRSSASPAALASFSARARTSDRFVV